MSRIMSNTKLKDKQLQSTNTSDFITNQDLFGYRFGFTFNQAGREHKTCLGGSVSVCVKFLFLYFLVRLLIKLILFQDPLTITF